MNKIEPVLNALLSSALGTDCVNRIVRITNVTIIIYIHVPVNKLYDILLMCYSKFREIIHDTESVT